jgi:hypothetical protein
MTHRSDEMKVGDFLDLFNSKAQEIVNKNGEYAKFLLHEKRDYKYYREEWIPLYAYICRFCVSREASIILGRERERWDAQIDGQYIEIAQALPKLAYQDRISLVNGQTLKDRIISIHLPLQFPQVIIKAIESKLEKSYPNNCILLVNVLGEYTRENDERIMKWLVGVRRRVKRGNFSKVYLVESARYKIFEIF